MQMELVFDFEDKFDFHMPDIEERPTTVGGLVRLVQAHLPDGSAPESLVKEPSGPSA